MLASNCTSLKDATHIHQRVWCFCSIITTIICFLFDLAYISEGAGRCNGASVNRYDRYPSFSDFGTFGVKYVELYVFGIALMRR